MKKICVLMAAWLLPVLIISVCLALAGCTHDDEPAIDYYVRYTAICHPDVKVRMYFTNETGENTHIDTSMPDGKFQYCIGPVKRGFKADMGVSYYDTGGYADFISIEVSEGAAPFVLKASRTDTSGVSYTIE